MKLHIFVYTCKDCLTSYQAPELSLNSYGEFLMRSVNGQVVYLNALSDPVFEEMNELLHEVCEQNSLDEFQYADLIHNIFGLACDLDSEGNEYSTDNQPNCPNCGCNDPSSWDEVYPPELIELNLPIVTHNRWLKLTKFEKLNLVSYAINSLNLKKL
jgi:hypothetical protein